MSEQRLFRPLNGPEYPYRLFCLFCKEEFIKNYRGWPQDDRPMEFNPDCCDNCSSEHDSDTIMRKYVSYINQINRKYDPEAKEKRRIGNKKNRANRLAHKAKRRAKKLKATPPWVNFKDITEIYNNCPPGYHVDHIIPLVNKNVCGLHVPWNLQILPASENLRKHNHYWLDPKNPLNRSFKK
jgi:hypothetical protein